MAYIQGRRPPLWGKNGAIVTQTVIGLVTQQGMYYNAHSGQESSPGRH
jgi:hypothetical protein